MRRLGEIAGTIAVLALLASCSKQTELTRDKARSVLTGAIPSVSQFPLAQSQVKTGQKDGMWRLADRLGIGMLQCQLTPKGQTLFKGCWQGTANLQGSLSGHAVEVLNPVPTSIKEITGITAGGEPGLKQVEFTYTLDIPENLKRYIRPETRAGVALLKLYDDGWRVAEFSGKGIIATEDVVAAEPTPTEAEKLDLVAQSDLRNAATAEEAYHVTHDQGFVSCQDAQDCKQKLPGFVASPGVTIVMTDKKRSFRGIAQHSSGTGKVFVYDSARKGMQGDSEDRDIEGVLRIAAAALEKDGNIPNAERTKPMVSQCNSATECSKKLGIVVPDGMKLGLGYINHGGISAEAGWSGSGRTYRYDSNDDSITVFNKELQEWPPLPED